MKNKKIIWLLSAYQSDSHAAWANWVTETFTDFNWFKLELPGRHFRWRIRGNPLSWLNKIPQKKPDLILATSMVDLATIKGLHPHLANVNCLYYFHENQFAYPVGKQQHTSVDPQMVQLYGALSANKILFNSTFNHDSFFNGVNKLLTQLPDEVPENVITQLKLKSAILPVAISEITSQETKNPKLILWNHRWEYDKAPQVFLSALKNLSALNIDFQLALLGDRPAKKTSSLIQIEKEFSDKIIISQKVSKQDYKKYLALSSIVVSTAIHEFQGLSMLEAVSAGAVPAVPDDLCYREQYASEFRYKAGDSHALAEKLFNYLNTQAEAPDVSYWYSTSLRKKWLHVLTEQ